MFVFTLANLFEFCCFDTSIILKLICDCFKLYFKNLRGVYGLGLGGCPPAARPAGRSSLGDGV